MNYELHIWVGRRGRHKIPIHLPQMVFLIVMKRQDPTPIYRFRIVYLDPKSMLWVNQHPHWYLHLLESGLVVARLNPINVRFGLQDPDL